MIWFRAASNSIAKNRVLTALIHGRHSPYPPRSTTQILCCRLHSTAAERKPTNCQSNQQFNFLHGINSAYLEELYRSWESDPDSVDGSWDQFFRNLTGQQSGVVSTQTIQESMRLQLLIRAYQVNGHRKANLDPLGLQHKRVPAELDPNFYGFTEDDLDRHFFVGELSDHEGISPAKKRQVESLRNIMERLERLYCGSIGYEYMHIHDREKNEWIRERIERAANAEERRRRKVAEGLIWAAELEGFLGRKWPAAKRFGLEGGEAVVPAVERAVERAAELGVETAVFGMAHRGRINVLGNVMGKPLRQIFNEFMAGKNISSVENGLYTGTGDVKYHLGTSCDRPIAANATSSSIHLSLVPNPSHLEAVDPVVVGKTRAKQYYSNDAGRAHTMGFLIHGDGSFVGQGVVYETLHLSGLARYTTGGTVHVIINNQVAFTTDPDQGRSSHYCTDVAKALDAPVLHVNGDDVEAVVRALELAVEWRQRFRWDVVVDVVCYRRYGHNEVDDPSITHPTMYKVIWNHPTVVDLYKKRLVESGHVTREEIDEMHDKINKMLLEEFEASKDYVPTKQDWLDSSWAGLKSPDQPCPDRNTGVKEEILKSIGKKVSALPKSLKAHKVVKKVYEQRAEMIDTGKGIDWAMSEALAFGSLIREGFHVRLSGQDVERGTFSHRHAVVHDQHTGEKYCPLQHLLENQNPEMFTISNSSLSEYGVLGFEFGYSSENPNSLVLWEAQFGDFANGAQVVFDQFLSSGEAKWLRQSGLVVLLPHGYDGQGPEHSSGRLERFLQMCDDNPYVILPPASSVNCNPIQQCNWQVVNVTTPANYFHVLRRQIHRDFRKPLIVMSPKNLLRHKDCKSNLSEFEDDYTQQQQGPGFKRLIEDQNVQSVLGKDVRRLIFCSGKVYYELDDERRRVNRNDIVICRIEQLCPLPYELIQQELQKYPNAEVVWCQEEPMNMGAYTYISTRLRTAMKGIGRGGSDVSDVKYVGRLPSAATATGFYQVHVQEQTQLLQKALQFQPISFP